MGFVAVVADSIGRRVNMAGNFGVSGYAAAGRNRYVAVYRRSGYQTEKEYVRRVGPVGSSPLFSPAAGDCFFRMTDYRAKIVILVLSKDRRKAVP